MEQVEPQILIDRDGSRRPLDTTSSAHWLAHVLLDGTTRAFLMSAGLDPQVGGEGVQVPVSSLLRALSSAAAQLPSAPQDVRASLAAHNIEAAHLLNMTEALRSTTSHRDAVVVPWGPSRPPLSVVTSAPEPAELLLSMDAVDASNVAEFLAHLAALPDDRELPPESLFDAIVPLLEEEATVGGAARVLARFGVTDAAEAVEHALPRVQGLATRLDVISALVQLGRRELGLRTLRSMVCHGGSQGRRRAIETVSEVASEGDVAFLRELLGILKGGERILIAATLYRLGDLSAYSLIADALAQLDSAAQQTEVAAALRVIEGLRSQRFVPLLHAYVAREERAFLRARANNVADALTRLGSAEPTPDQLLEVAEEAYFQNRPSDAREHLERLEELGCPTPRSLYIYANCLKDEGQQDEALEACDRGLAVDSTYWRNHRLRGSLLWDLGRHEDALVAYNRALNLNPVDPYTWYYKGYVLYRLRRDEEALPCLDRALSLKVDSPYIHNQKAFCLERLGRYEEAVRSYQRSLQLRAEDLTIRDYLGQALQQCGRLQEALEHYEHVLRVDPSRSETIYHRADVLYDMERWVDAADCFSDYVALESDSYNGWFHRGLCLRFMGAYGEAAESFKRALLLRPDSVNARRHLVYCEERSESS